MCIVAAAAAGAAGTAASATMMNLAIASSVASTAMSYQQNRSAASAQRRYQQAQYDQDMAYREELNEHQMEQYLENAERATDEVKRNYKEINERIGQEAVTASLEINELFRQSRQLQTNEIATAAERGVDGGSVDALLDNIKFNELRAVQNVRMEQQWRLDQYESTKQQIEAQGNARVESMNPQPIALPALPQPVQSPNPLGTLLNMGSNVLGIMNSFNYDPWRSSPTAATPIHTPYVNPNTGNAGSNRLIFGNTNLWN